MLASSTARQAPVQPASVEVLSWVGPREAVTIRLSTAGACVVSLRSGAFLVASWAVSQGAAAVVVKCPGACNLSVSGVSAAVQVLAADVI